MLIHGFGCSYRFLSKAREISAPNAVLCEAEGESLDSFYPLNAIRRHTMIQLLLVRHAVGAYLIAFLLAFYQIEVNRFALTKPAPNLAELTRMVPHS